LTKFSPIDKRSEIRSISKHGVILSLYSSVKNEKVSELIAQQIKDSILNGTMKTGDRLPPVRKLVEHFEASPASVREALKSLEASGLVTIKPGSGVFVAVLSSQPMGECLTSILRIRKTSIDEITQARVILEPAIVRLASRNRSPEDLEKLDLNIRESRQLAESHQSGHAKNIEFHALVAEATHNVILILTAQTVLDALREITLEIRDSRFRLKVVREIVRIHTEIVKAIKNKSVDEAYKLMLKDVLNFYFHRTNREFKSQGE
jgi:GntR family transcriptional regulator, transcriptional repressor for pyruvate dehydrogenase complex